MNSETTTERPPRTLDQLGRYAWWPIPLLLALIVALWVAGLQTVYESRSLMVVLNLFFTLLASLCICFLTARGFLHSGQPALLMFGCGLLLWGLTSLAAAMIVGFHVNPTITVHNLGALVAALCHLIGLLWSGQLQRPGRWLVVSYTGVLLISALILWAATSGWLPVFFVQGHGGTLVRQVVLILAITTFALVGWRMASKFRLQPGSFYYWYGLGLALVATGLTGVLLLTVQGSLMGWVNRLTQYLGSAYLFVAAFMAAREAGTLSLTAKENAWSKLLPCFEQKSLWEGVSFYLLAVVAVGVAMGLRMALEAWIGPGLPTYVTFYPAMMAVLIMTGFGPGIIASILMAFIAAYWILPPVGQFFIASPVDRLGLAVFTVMNLFMSVIAEFYRRNRVKAAAYDREVALRERDQHLRLAYAAAKSGAWEWNLQSNKNIWSDELWRLYGLELNSCEPSYEAWQQTIHPDDRTQVEQAVQEAASKGQELSVEWRRVLEVGGTERWLMSRGQPLQDDTGAVTRYIGIVLDITERKQAEEALRQSEERLRLAQDVAGIGTWEWSPKSGTTTWSPEIERLHGVAPGTLISYQEWRKLVHPEDIARVEAVTNEAITNRRQLDMEFRIIRPSGELRWVATLGGAIYNGSGGVVRAFGVNMDITERKRAEEVLRQQSETALRLSELEFRSLAESMPQIVWATLPDGSNIYFNQQWVDYTGMTMEESHGNGWNAPFHPDDKQRAWDAWQRATQHNERYSLECRLRRADGVYRWWLIRGEPMRDENGVIKKWFGTCTDIEELKRSEAMLHEAKNLLERRVDERTKALKESEEQFRVLIQNLQSAVALVNERGAFTIVNQAFLRIFELNDDSSIKNVNDRDWSQWQVFDEHGTLLDVDEHPVRKAALARRQVRDQLIAVKAPANPNIKWLLVSAEPILDSQGHIYRLICTYHDITDRKRAEEQIKAALAEKEVMLKEIHHRVKNNLQVISSLVSMQADNLTDEQTREEFDDVCDRVRSMALIHEKLYQTDDLARLNFADYSTSLLHSLWSSHDVLAEKVKLTLALVPVMLSIETAVPCGLLLNELAGNALKHAFPNGSDGEVMVGLKHDSAADTACLWVRDNGIGLAPGFDWRQSSSLGLRLVQILAGQLHGTVETGTGPGAEFRVTFPLKGSQS